MARVSSTRILLFRATSRYDIISVERALSRRAFLFSKTSSEFFLMSFLRAGQLARETPTARPDDTLGLVAENLRDAKVGTIPVFDSDAIETREIRHASLLGVIDERDLSGAVLEVLRRQNVAQNSPVAVGASAWSNGFAGATHSNGANSNGASANGAFSNGAYSNGASSNSSAAQNIDIEYSKSAPNVAVSAAEDEKLSREMPQAVRELKARDVMQREIGFVPAVFSLENALLALDRYNVNALPVIDGVEGYKGMISRADVVAALGEQVRPPTVGGMATPLGVWLTTGVLNGGAPPLGLVLSGAVLAACQFFSGATITLALAFFRPQWANLFASGLLSAATTGDNSFNIAATAIQGLLFLLFLRALPMAGVHAAEHQTVWAIEKGLPLRPEIVAKMPRAHPRCGTNLVALAGLILIIFQHLPDRDSYTVLLALLFVFFFWRRFGEFLQVAFTTKPATRKQLESGIRAGEEVIAKYQKNPHALGSFGQNLLNSGIAFSAVGMTATLFLLNFAQDWALAHWLPVR